MFHELLVVGGGASGIIASITAKDMGKDVGVLDSSNRIGAKILTTGNGRCNITNENISPLRYHSENPNFFKYALEKFSVEETKNFFYSLGLPLTTLEDNKMYPLSLQASSVLDILRFAIDDRNIPIYLNSKVRNISKSLNGFQIFTTTGETYECKKLILCCGGKSAPNTGSDGSGFNLARNLGHSIVNPIPALVQLKLEYKNLKALSGVKFNGGVTVVVNNVLKKDEFGEILFTDYGISGPPILQISRIASYSLSKGEKVQIIIDMMPNLTKNDLLELLENHWGLFGYRSVVNSFIGLINKKIIPILLKEACIKNIHKPCYDLEWDEKQKIVELLKEWCFTVYDTNTFKDSQVTAGGVNTKDIDPMTFESKIVENLFFAGEILDVDGDCGGFNLQWSWSSGFIAGKNAADK